MTIQQFIEKAIEGGWWPKDCNADYNTVSKYGLHLTWHRGDGEVDSEDTLIPEIILLDPLAWKAVGKVEGWGTMTDRGKWKIYKKSWLAQMHRMIDALAEGRTIQQYLETL